ncbi:MAG: PAS domain S-box protein [Minwuia sp.]|nr:PAS domain S-box protein [Minwuia sp.]
MLTTPESPLPDNATFRAIVDQSMDGIIVHRDSRIVYANAAAERIYGFARGALIGTNPYDLLAVEDRAGAAAQSTRRLQGDVVQERSAFRGIHSDGGQIEIEVLAFLVEWAGGPAIAVSINDVTARNTAIARNDEAEGFIRQALELAPLPSLIIVDDHFRYANLSARKLFSPDGQALVGQSAMSLYRDPEMRQTAMEMLARDGVINGLEAPMVRHDGVTITCLIYTVKTVYGGQEAFFTTMVDQTELRAAQAHTRRTEAMLTAVMEHAPVGFAFRDLSGRFELINAHNADHWGHPVAEIIGRRAADFSSPEAAQWCQILDNEAVRTGKLEREATFDYDEVEGARRIRSIRFPVRDTAGKILGVANFAVDITVEWRAQEAMKAAEAEARRVARVLRLIVEHAPIAFTYRDRDRRVQMMNPIAADWIGHTEEEVLGKVLDAMPNFAATDLTRDIDARVFEEHETFDETIRMAVSGGRTLSVRAIRFPVFESPGVLAGVCNMGLDQSGTVAAQELMSATLDAARLAILRTDDQGIIESFNPAAEEAFGYTAAEVIGQDTFMLLHEDAAQVHRAAIARVEETGESPFIGKNIALDCVRKDGKTFIADLCVGEAIVDGQRKYIGTIRDLTQLRAAEQQLRQAQKMEAVGQLTGGIAHDFNNLIAVISGNLELLGESDGLDDRQTSLIESAQRATGRGADLTSRLLSFARHRPVALETFDVGESARAALGILNRTIGNDIRLHLDGGQGLWVRSDPAQFDTAILNLVVNARDAMPEGGDIRISIRRSSRVGEVVIAVSDSGTGMPEDVRARAFEPFYTTKAVGKGSGLGLSMVYGFAKQSDGRALIRSGDAGGTCVEIHLPLVDVTGFEGAAAGPDAVPSATILLIEPDGASATHLTEDLEALGHEVISFPDTERGMGFLRLTRKIDFLLVSDALIGDEPEEFPVIWAWRNRPELRAILLTSGEGRLPAAFDNAPDQPHLPTLVKPFSTDDLIRSFGNARESQHHVQ